MPPASPASPALIALLYQALPPPVIDGLRKDAKPGGYSDGGADIAFALPALGVGVVTPVANPDPATAMDWVFPDTAAGIDAAIAAGANTLWANTVLFDGHPLENCLDRVAIVGQLPHAMQAFDDKFSTNHMLRSHGLPVARSFLLARTARDGVRALADVTQALTDEAIAFPLIVKPVRGRGSQGVTLVRDDAALLRAATDLLDGGRFGDTLMIEEFLAGDELTVTVMPPRAPTPPGRTDLIEKPDTAHWCLRPVLRFAQKDGVAPYNGDVAVTENSVAIPADRMADPAIAAMLDDCASAAAMVGSRAAIRIDCRADASGSFKLFDLNMKPNMTGAGRPGRETQDCLSAIAARADGWTYPDMLAAMRAAAWTQTGE